MNPTVVRSMLFVAIVLGTAAMLPEAAFGWRVPPVLPPNSLVRTRVLPPGSGLPALWLPPHLGLPAGGDLSWKVRPQDSDPLEETRRWAECLNAYNAARLRERSFGNGPGPRLPAPAPNPFGPCGV